MFSGESSTGYGSSHTEKVGRNIPMVIGLRMSLPSGHLPRGGNQTFYPYHRGHHNPHEGGDSNPAAEPEKKTFIWKGTEYPSEEAEKIRESEQP